MTLDEIKAKPKPGTYRNDDGLLVVVFRCDEVFGVAESKYAGPQLYELEKTALPQTGWHKASRQLQLAFSQEGVCV